MGLFGPAWMSKKPRDAKKAVDEISEITSQDKLAKRAGAAGIGARGGCTSTIGISRPNTV